MKAYLIDKIVVCGMVPGQRVRAEHMKMFHGDARRGPDDRDGRSWKDYTLRSRLRHPLRLRRSGTFVPDLFMPGPTTLVVSERLKGMLERFANIKFFEVLFEKLVDLHVEKDDFRMSEMRRANRGPAPDRIIYDLPDVPMLHSTVLPYHEVIIADYEDIKVKYDPASAKFLEVLVPEMTGYDDARVLGLWPEMLMDFPLFWHGVYPICNEEVHKILSPHLDQDYFIVIELNLDYPE